MTDAELAAAVASTLALFALTGFVLGGVLALLASIGGRR